MTKLLLEKGIKKNQVKNNYIEYCSRPFRCQSHLQYRSTYITIPIAVKVPMFNN